MLLLCEKFKFRTQDTSETKNLSTATIRLRSLLALLSKVCFEKAYISRNHQENSISRLSTYLTSFMLTVKQQRNSSKPGVKYFPLTNPISE